MNKILLNRFGTSERLQLSRHEWLTNCLHAKTVRFDVGRGGGEPEVTWEDRVASVGLIQDRALRSLACILVWGSDDKWDWQEYFDCVVEYLASRMMAQCRTDGREALRGGNHSLDELCRLIARMTLHFELYNLWDLYTIKGRLVFSGVHMNDRTYSNHFLKYQQAMLDELQGMVVDINQAVYKYVEDLEH